MKKGTAVLAITLIFVALLLSYIVFAATLPDSFKGSLKINNTAAPVGTQIKATINSVDRTMNSPFLTNASGSYSNLRVAGSDNDVGHTITFMIKCSNGTFVAAPETDTFIGGQVNVQRNLTATCVTSCTPSAEVCDSVDNDCDNIIDESYDVGASCTSGVGVCQRSGSKVCSQDKTTTVCNAIPGNPTTETCNSLDDDCDGASDEGTGGGSCSTGQSGVCSVGTTACVSGQLACNRNVNPSTETCNSLDDDCDGTSDENYDVGASCSDGVGACQASGTKVCTQDGSGTTCNAVPGDPSPEMCNSLDDDCDSNIDEIFDVGTPCSSGVGACYASGFKRCTLDSLATECDATPGNPSSELCNGIDDNCNSQTDEGYNVGSSCSAGVGACERNGTKVCTQDGSSSICNAVLGDPSTEICNNLDDDCDGLTDEGGVCVQCVDNDGDGYGPNCSLGNDCNDNNADIHPGSAESCNSVDDDCDSVTDEGYNLGVSCSVGVGACQRSGAKVCTQDGTGTQCNATAGTPTAEICNSLDDDCDGVADEDNICQQEFCIIVSSMKILNQTFHEVDSIDPGTFYNVHVINTNVCGSPVRSMQIVQVKKGLSPVNLATVTSTIDPGKSSNITIGFMLSLEAKPGDIYNATAFNWNRWIDESSSVPFQILSATRSATFAVK